MRVYSLTGNGMDFLGCENDGVMVDLTRAISLYDITKNGCCCELVQDIETMIQDGCFTLEFIGEILEFVAKHGLTNDLAVGEEYMVNPPLYPGKIIALGNNYHKHIKEMNNKIPAQPVIFGKWPSTVIGQGDTIEKPSWTGMVSYEAELAFIIGTEAKNVPAAEAMKYVAGYTCLNDVTARDLQRKDRAEQLPWMQSKNFDTFTPLGPCVLLSGTVKEPVEIGVRSRLNGETRQNGNTRDFIFDIPTVIEYITKIMTLEPGDVVTTGTPEGVGALEPGDVIEVECEGIGTLSNPVIAMA